MASGRPVWLGGPVEGVPLLLQPVAHALIEAKEDVQSALAAVTDADLWKSPGNAASAGFHVKHAMGSLDRLFTYARGESLSEAQLAALAAEKTIDERAGSATDLVRQFSTAIDRAVDQLRATSDRDLLEPREVGRAKLPSNVIGLLVHAGDHTYRHVGQMITTLRIAGTSP